jgi:hypothetical protein
MWILRKKRSSRDGPFAPLPQRLDKTENACPKVQRIPANGHNTIFPSFLSSSEQRLTGGAFSRGLKF